MFYQELCFHHGPHHEILTQIEVFAWIIKCQKAFKAIKQRYLNAPILIAPKWEIEVHEI
jgi:hypothetical protein